MGHHKNGMKSTRLGAFPDARGDALFSTVETVLETLTQNKLFKCYRCFNYWNIDMAYSAFSNNRLRQPYFSIFKTYIRSFF